MMDREDAVFVVSLFGVIAAVIGLITWMFLVFNTDDYTEQFHGCVFHEHHNNRLMGPDTVTKTLLCPRESATEVQ